MVNGSFVLREVKEVWLDAGRPRRWSRSEHQGGIRCFTRRVLKNIGIDEQFDEMTGYTIFSRWVGAVTFVTSRTDRFDKITDQRANKVRSQQPDRNTLRGKVMVTASCRSEKPA